MITYYKVLNAQHNSPYGRDLDWARPTRTPDGTWTPGAWMPDVAGNLVLCRNGYHVCEGKDLLGWLGPHIYRAEIAGDSLSGGNKTVARRIRLIAETAWNRERAVLFAADCAARVLSLFEATQPGDTRPREAIILLRRWARGENVTEAELRDAAARADYAADAADAARADYAARAAARAADAADAADAAAAARATAAARAAYAAERQWQIERLLAYLAPELPAPWPLP
jgi:hypothetical protein